MPHAGLSFAAVAAAVLGWSEAALASVAVPIPLVGGGLPAALVAGAVGGAYLIYRRFSR